MALGTLYHATRRRLVSFRAWLGVSWASAVIAFEVLGRRSPSDVADGIGVLALVILTGMTFAAHRVRPVPVAGRLLAAGGRLRVFFARHTPQFGVDFRERPAVGRGFPPLLARSTAGIAVIAMTLAALHPWLPGGLRRGLLAVSGTAYFVALALLWALLAGIAVFAATLTGLNVHNWMANAPRFQGPRRARLEAAAILGVLALLLAAALTLPPWTPLATVGVTLFVSLLVIIMPGAPSLEILWRLRHGGHDHRATSWVRVVACATVAGGGLLAAAVVLSSGDSLAATGAPNAMPVTAFLGAAAAWSGALGYAVWAWLLPIRTFVLRFRDPAKPRLVPVALPSREARGRTFALARAGFHVVRVESGACPVVRVLLDDGRIPLERGGRLDFHTWGTLTVHPDDLRHPDVHEAVRQHDRVGLRRAFFEGIRRLWDFARTRRFRHGHGVWLAPHLWYISHMSRDTNEDDTWTVGPPYHHVLSLDARHHLYEVMRSAEVDLIFVEDGLAFESVERVFSVLFDLLDMFGGSRAEERHFDGLTGVRVVVHDYAPGQPFREDAYPEVDYDEIGRARILHAFKDRGGAEEPDEVPADVDLKPQAVGV